MKVLKVFSVFAGFGGLDLGFERAGMKVVAQCEIDPWCQQILNKHWPDVPIYDDVRTVTRERMKADGIDSIDVICGGYPCQPFSIAGKRDGEKDDRHLWPEMLRLIHEIRPTWVVGENVAGHISMGLDQVLSDLENEGYTVQTFVIPACAVDAPHRRDRVWIVAHTEGQRSGKAREFISRPKERPACPSSTPGNVANANSVNGGAKWNEPNSLKRSARHEFVGSGETVANSKSERLQINARPLLNRIQKQIETIQRRAASRRIATQGRTWPAEPRVGRVADGVPNRVERLRGLGNAVVPQIPQVIGEAIMEASQ